MNRNLLKYIAAVAMLIDHIEWLLIPPGEPIGVLCSVIGRLTAPIMCYFIAEGFYYTSSKRRYAGRLLLFAVLSQPIYDLACGTTIFDLNLNMLFTLFLSFCVLWVYTGVKQRPLCWLLIVVLLAVSTRCDWMFFAPLWTLMFYIFRDSRKKQAIAFTVISAVFVCSSILSCLFGGRPWYDEIWQAGLILFLPFLFLYNGKSGSRHAFHKWFFYAFYPLHLLLLIWIRLAWV